MIYLKWQLISFGKILFNAFFEERIWFYFFIFFTLQFYIFVGVLKDMYIILEYTIRKLPNFFRLIVFFCVIASSKYIRQRGFNFRDILILWTLMQEVGILILFLHFFKSNVKPLLIIIWKYSCLYKWFLITYLTLNYI